MCEDYDQLVERGFSLGGGVCCKGTGQTIPGFFSMRDLGSVRKAMASVYHHRCQGLLAKKVAPDIIPIAEEETY